MNLNSCKRKYQSLACIVCVNEYANMSQRNENDGKNLICSFFFLLLFHSCLIIQCVSCQSFSLLFLFFHSVNVASHSKHFHLYTRQLSVAECRTRYSLACHFSSIQLNSTHSSRCKQASTSRIIIIIFFFWCRKKIEKKMFKMRCYVVSPSSRLAAAIALGVRQMIL